MNRRTRPTRLVLWLGNDVWGSTEAYLARLATGVATQRPSWRVTLVAPQPVHERAAGSVPGSVEIVASPTTVTAAVRLVRRLAPDVLHVNDPGILGLTAARVARVPRTVLTLHTPELEISWNRRARALWRFGSRNGRITVVTMSGTNEQIARRRYGIPGASVVIDPGVDPAATEPPAPWPWSQPSSLRIAFAGRLEPEKDLHILVHAAATANQALAGEGGLQLALIGEGSCRPQLERLITDLRATGAVQLVGWLDRPGRLLTHADAFAMSSSTEGLPFALLEALSLGLPIVSTAVGGIPDVVSADFGILVPAGDQQAMAAALVDLARDPGRRCQMGATAQAVHARRFSTERMVSSTIAVYEGASAPQP